MLSSLRSYLSARFFSESTDAQLSEASGTELENHLQKDGNIHTPDKDATFVVGLKDIVSFAVESSTKFADELKTTAKQISEKITSSAPFVEFDRAQSDFVSAKNKEELNVDGAISSPNFIFSSDATGSDEIDSQRRQRVKEQILRLSLEEQNFLRPPPHGSCFQWNHQLARQYTPIAVALLKEDANLAALRFRLVPRRVNEDDFWRNYFYRVSLICQSEDLPSETVPFISKPVTSEGTKPSNQHSDQQTKAEAEKGTGNGSTISEEGHLKQNLSPPLSSPIALSLASGKLRSSDLVILSSLNVADLSVDLIEAELMLEGSELESSVAIDDNMEREILAELNDLEE
ncbi:unnamed protein product [Hydatigera taeniaeformis]|uniref:BSD domain-containing protein n=1 Tax=Hydatigena taeniaeformis TaxID=6205 RepID=A0A0R3X286_HYDTA|nr:unnamed protein product [Hydatigera taeniaeformis]